MLVSALMFLLIYFNSGTLARSRWNIGSIPATLRYFISSGSSATKKEFLFSEIRIFYESIIK